MSLQSLLQVVVELANEEAGFLAPSLILNGVGFADLASRDAVLAAIGECDKLGEETFLSQRGFGPSRHVRLLHEGKSYPAKAILGVAHAYEFPDEGPLAASEFTSGDSTISKLSQLGFTARSVSDGTSSPELFVVRGGAEEEVVDYALENAVVATGWTELGDLSGLDDQAVEGKLDEVYAHLGQETRAQWRSALRAFREIDLGDWVILPMTSRGKLAVGVVTGGYEHRPENPGLATNVYPVRWLDEDVPRELLGDLRSRVDRQPAVHKIAVDNAVSLVERMLERREPIRLPGERRLAELFEATLTAIADKDLEQVRRRVDVDGPQLLDELLSHRYQLASGTGQATPADVPWISLHPEGTAVSAQQGVYAVYLFSADGAAVYLSLNQGTEKVAGGLRPLRKRALDIRRAARLDATGDPVALASNNVRPRKYEASSAYAIRYPVDGIPPDAKLLEDLRAVVEYVEAARASGLELDPNREPLHLLFKWSRDLEPETIERHQAIADEHGQTWWASLGAAPSTTKLRALRAQLEDGTPTRAYLYGDKRLFSTRLIGLATEPEAVPDEEIPDYFDKSEAGLFACLEDFRELEPGWALDNLLVASDPDPQLVGGALGNTQTPLYVYERFPLPEPTEAARSELTMEWLRIRTLWRPEDLEELLSALDPASGKGQVILAGPPGTGKTWVAEHVARYLSQDEPLQRRLVQFHPSYGYEEFVEGIRPVAGEQGISFKPVKGTVLVMAEAMEATEDIHVLVIDELNRANIPRVFGELMYLLEYRDQAIDLQYSRGFQLPESLRIIATMNTADRSIRSIDVALRRRFEIFECPPDAGVLERFYELPENSTSVANLIPGFKELNADLTDLIDRHHTIGHSFFMSRSYDRKRLEVTWRRQILPLIEEYFFDRPDAVADFKIERYWPADS